MPIRQPNGIWMPTFSPASSSDVAPSISTCLSDMDESDGAALSAVVGTRDGEALHVQAVAQPRVRPSTVSTASSMAVGPHAHVGRSRQSGTKLSRSLEIEMAICVGQLQMNW